MSAAHPHPLAPAAPARLAAVRPRARGLALAAAAAAWLGATTARAEVERYALLIANNAGEPGEVGLRYAEDDALKLQAVLSGLGGFEPANVAVLRGEGVATARRALIALNDRIRQRMAAPNTQSILFVYYSGHADARALHLAGSRWELAELEQLVRGSAATFRLLALDACRSGALTRVKGASAAAPFSITLDAGLPGQGVVFLTSSSANEDAQESDALRGSFFTHHLTSGLLGAGDADRDGQVTLEEAYRYAYDHTLQATSRTFAGVQHPTYRYELRGQGKLVLTVVPRRDASRATLVLPAGRSYLLARGEAGGPVVAEVGPHDAGRRLSLRPGRYYVIGRGPRDLVEGSLDAPAGGETLVADERLRVVAYERLVRKGGGPSYAQGLEAGYRLRTAFASGDPACHGVFAGYGLTLAAVDLRARLVACTGATSNDALAVRADEFGAALRASYAWDAPWVTLSAGVEAGGSLLRQTFTTGGRAPSRDTGAAHVGATGGVRLPLPGGFSAFSELSTHTYFFRERGSSPPREVSLASPFTLQLLLGVGKTW